MNQTLLDFIKQLEAENAMLKEKLERWSKGNFTDDEALDIFINCVEECPICGAKI